MIAILYALVVVLDGGCLVVAVHSTDVVMEQHLFLAGRDAASIE
jgi:hypothetical protein